MMQIEKTVEYKDGTMQIEVKKRNIEKMILPKDRVTIKSVIYEIERMEQGEPGAIKMTLKPKKRKHITLMNWLKKNTITNPIQVANAGQYTCANIIAYSYELVTEKYDFLWEKQVKKVEHEKGLTRIWLTT